MTTIESQRVVVNAPQPEVFEFLSDLNNYKVLFPEDRISDWEATETSCQFKIQGTATIALVFDKSTPNSEINLVSGEKSPFPFTLNIYLEEPEDSQTKGWLVFNGEMNMMLKMMVEKPLTNLFNYMAEQVKKQYD